MPRRVYTKEELLKAWKEKEEQIKKEKTEEVIPYVTKACKNCANSFYRYVPPTGTFTEPAEFCGCRKKVNLVDPNASCESFSRR